MWEDKSKWYLDQLKANGMKVLLPSPELMTSFNEIGSQLTAEWLKRAGKDGEEIFAAFKK
jgi:TRAP-type C4-dicarboxylate transport system substrate-binding protein